jgi:hypothetical protein
MVSVRTGITLTEFNNITPLELSHLMREYAALREQQYREGATLHRMFTLRIVNAQIAAAGGRQYNDAQHFMRFTWEDEIDNDIEQDLIHTNWEALDFIYAN